MKEPKKYYLEVEKAKSGAKVKVYVTETVYKAYWQETNKENYRKRVDRKNHLSFFSELEDENGRNFEERFAEGSIDVEALVNQSLEREALLEAIASLSDEEQNLIQDIFYNRLTQEEIAKNLGINQRTVGRRRDKIFKKLKAMLEENE